MTNPDPLPPPPGGILWSIAGDVRMALAMPSAMVMQVAHPAVGAGVDRYSVFRTDPWGRGERSLRSVRRWVYGGETAAEEGRRLRRLHRAIQGVDPRGRPYRALDPATYAWVHATGFPVYRHAQRYLGRRPFTADEERRLYAEWLQVGRVLGIEEGDMPRALEEFQPYYLRMLREEVERTPVADELLRAERPLPPPEAGPRPLRLFLRALWPLLAPPFAWARRFLTAGLMPPEAREALGVAWTPRQERELWWLGRAAAVLVPLLPERLRYPRLAREARRAHRAALRRRASGARTARLVRLVSTGHADAPRPPR